MRVVVTGAAGFIGSRLAATLLERGHDIVGIDAFLEESYNADLKRANLQNLLANPGFAFHEVDLRHVALEPILEGADAVVNEAAMPGLFPSWQNLELYISHNLIALGCLLDAARATEIGRFVQISTSSVYGRNAVGGEDQPTEPTSPYGVSKLAAEKLLLAHVENFGFPGMILRYFSVYGPGQRPDMAYNIFSEALIDGREITVFGDGTQSRSNTFIDDCVDGTVRAVERFHPGEIFNIAGGRSIQLLDAIGILSERIGIPARITFSPSAPGDQYETNGDITRARAALDYHPRVDPEVGLRAQAAWHLDRRALLTESVVESR